MIEEQITKDILKKVRQVEVRTHRLVNDSLAGSYHSVFKGCGMNFEEVRAYVPGDDIRSIDWNVTARTGELHIKKFTEERELTIMLLIDISGSGSFGSGTTSKRELMAELGSLLAFSAVRNNDKVGLILFSDHVELYVPAKKGRSHILRVIREILFFKATSPGTDICLPLDFLNRINKRRCVAFLISDFCLPGIFQESLQQLQPKLKISNRRHDLVAVHISDPHEMGLPDVGWIRLEDSETGQQIELNTSDIRIRQRYADLARTRKSSLFQTIRGSGVDLLDLSTNRAYLPALLDFFGTHKHRRGR
jgi:uncharacterized protein (DUF58 family)